MTAMELRLEDFVRLTQGDTPVLVEFMAPWCGYCRRIGPAFDRLAGQYAQQVILRKTDIDREPGLAEAEGIEVVPTLVLYHRGQVLGSIVAPESGDMIQDFLREKLGI